MVKVSNVGTWIASQALKPVKTVPSLFGCLSKRRQTKTSTLQCQNVDKAVPKLRQKGSSQDWVSFELDMINFT